MSLKSQNGSSLVEVMISLFILAIGLMGILATQIRSMQMNQNAYLYSQANVLVNDIYESMRTSRSALNSYMHTFDESIPSEPACTGANSCTPDDIATWSMHHWLSNVEALLPAGKGEITAAGSMVTISIRFRIGFDSTTEEPLLDYVNLTVEL